MIHEAENFQSSRYTGTLRNYTKLILHTEGVGQGSYSSKKKIGSGPITFL